jgi:hypothetical protein
MTASSSLLERVSAHQGVHRIAELAALCALAIAQPVFAVISDAVDFLVFRQVGGMGLVVFALLLILGPPLLLFGVEELLGWIRPAAKPRLHLLFVTALFTLAVLQMFKVGLGPRPLPLLFAAVVASAFAVAYGRFVAVRLWARIAAPAPLVFAMLFLFTSPVSALLLKPRVAAAGATEGKVAPVVVLVLDELPLVSLLDGHGRIDAELYPNLAAFSNDATFFRNATGVAARTPHALPAMLTGRFPVKSLAPVTSQYPTNLFALLNATHEVHAFESVTALCPVDACEDNEFGAGRRTALFGDSFAIWMRTLGSGSEKDPVGRWYREETVRGARRSVSADDAGFLLGHIEDNQPVRFQEFLAAIDGEGMPFHFLHLMLPHAPWRYVPDGTQYESRSIGLVSHDQRTAERWPALVDHQRHLLQTMYTDRLVGQVVERLRQVGLYDKAAVLITADHGISFIPGLPRGTRDLRKENQHDVAWVPFLLKAPGQQEGTVRDDNVMGVDIAPTLAELAGVRTPWRVDGMSLVSARRETVKKVWSNEPGAQVELEAQQGFSRVLSTARGGMTDLQPGADGLFKLGPLGHLVGTPVEGHRVVAERDAVARVQDLDAYGDVQPAGGIVPALVTGSVVSSSGPLGDARVAIALNGTVAAVSDLYREGDTDGSFAAMVPAAAFRPGKNQIEVFRVDAQAERVVLRRMALRS